MSDKSKRLRKLEGLIKEPAPKDTTTFSERLERGKKIRKVRQARHEKWLSRATRDQLVIGLKRVDLLEEAWDRKVATECAVAARERRIPHAWASAPRFIMTREYFRRRVAIVGRLMAGNPNMEVCRGLVEGVEGVKGGKSGIINAELILAAIETAATEQLRHVEVRGVA